MSVRRFDASTLGNVERTPQGGIKVPARLTRVGVFPYRMGDGTVRRELRPPEEVFATESLASLADAPVTDLHPGEPVTSANWRTYSIGHVASPAHVDGEEFVAAALAIQDAPAIDKIDRGERKEVSLGYMCELEEVSGTWRGLTFDAIQRSIRYNHVAIGPEGWGRAGPQVAMRLDSADGIIEDEGKDQNMKIKIAGKEYEQGSAEAAKALADVEAKAARADAAEAELSKAKRSKIVEAVRTLRARAGKRLDEKEAAAVDTASDLDLMLMLLKTDPSFDAENTSEEYIRGCFAAYVKRAAAETTEEPIEEPLDSTTETIPAVAPVVAGPAGLERALDSITAIRPKKLPATTKAKTAAGGARADGTRDDADDAIDSDKARQRMIEANRKAAASPLRLVSGGRRGRNDQDD